MVGPEASPERSLRRVVRAPSPKGVAELCATWICRRLHDAIDARGVASLALSGGSSPVALLQSLALSKLVNWDLVDIFQVDERRAPTGSPDRNETQLREFLLTPLRHPLAKTHMVFGNAADDGNHVVEGDELPSPDAAAEAYAGVLERVCGNIVDVVHLGLGDDGHTASLVPGDSVLFERRVFVGSTRVYKGFRRVTLTYPALESARHIAWFVVGHAKAPMVHRLCVSDPSIPAGCVRANDDVIFADADAARLCPE